MNPQTSKGPNPFITDTNDPRYTELSKFGANNLLAGLLGETDALVNRGFTVLTPQRQPTIQDVAVGDLALIGNRGTGMVTVVQDIDGLVVAITVDENIGFTPVDYRSDPTEFGNKTQTIRETTYVLGLIGEDDGDGGNPEIEVHGNISMEGLGFLNAGKILIIKRQTEDKTTWPAIAQAAAEYNPPGYNQPETMDFSLATATTPDTYSDVPITDLITFLNTEAETSFDESTTVLELYAYIAGLDWDDELGDRVLITAIATEFDEYKDA